jgi:protein-tyrosine phosphatase
MTAELPADAAGVVYRAVPMLDLVVPTVEQLDAAVDAIAELKWERPTLVCCALG